MRALALAACVVAMGCGDAGSTREITASVTASGDAAQPDAMFKLAFSVTLEAPAAGTVVEVAIAGRPNVSLVAGAGGVYSGETLGLAAAVDFVVDGAASAHVELPARPAVTMMLLPSALEVDWTPALLANMLCLTTPGVDELCQQSVSPGSTTFMGARQGVNTVRLTFSKVNPTVAHVTAQNLLTLRSSITR